MTFYPIGSYKTSIIHEPMDVEEASISEEPLTLEPEVGVLQFEKQRLIELAKTIDSTYTSRGQAQNFVRTFAIIHGDVFLKGAPYTSSPLDQINYWRKCIDLWKTDPCLSPANPQINPQTLKEMSSSLTRINSAQNLLYYESSKEMLCFIQKDLHANSQCILPLVTHPSKATHDGHAFSCVIDQDNEGKITLNFLNKGGVGSSFNPIVSLDAQKKVSYKHAPIVLNTPYFFRDCPSEAEHLLRMVMNYKKCTPERGYDDSEIYLLFLNFGQIVELQITEDIGVKLQRSGTCPGAFAKLICRNYFYEQHDLYTYKRLIFYLKFQSLWDLYLLWDTHEDIFQHHAGLIKRAIKQFAYIINKNIERHPPLICKQEAMMPEYVFMGIPQ